MIKEWFLKIRAKRELKKSLENSIEAGICAMLQQQEDVATRAKRELKELHELFPETKNKKSKLKKRMYGFINKERERFIKIAGTEKNPFLEVIKILNRRKHK